MKRKTVNFSFLHFTILVLLLIKIDGDRVWVNYCEILVGGGNLLAKAASCRESIWVFPPDDDFLKTRFLICFDNVRCFRFRRWDWWAHDQHCCCSNHMLNLSKIMFSSFRRKWLAGKNVETCQKLCPHSISSKPLERNFSPRKIFVSCLGSE